MKFLQVAIFAIVMVASAHALSCNVGTVTGTCPAIDLGTTVDNCYRCVLSSGTAASGCTTAAGALACASIKTTCEAGKGTFSSCTTANCNGCSPASALQVSAFLLLAVLSAMFF